MSDFTTPAILLRRVEYGDHDYIITFFSRDYGKISTIAKNAKKSVRRFSGGLDLFSLSRIHCAVPKKKKTGLIHLSAADIEDAHAHIRTDVMATGYAGYWMEILNRFLEEKKAESGIFDLSVFSLSALNSRLDRKTVISLTFQIRFLSLAGLAPEISGCNSCGKDLDNIRQNRVRFDFKAGRIICDECLDAGRQYGTAVSKGTLKLLSWLLDSDIRRTGRAKFSPQAVREGEVVLESFVRYHLGREFKSLSFLNRLR